MTIPAQMRAVVLTGHGGLDKLELRNDVAVPQPVAGEVLIAVGACGINNTDINTRTAWYSRSVTEATDGGGFAAARESDSTWGGTGLRFPRIQGADVAGRIVAVGTGVAAARVGERVLVDPWLRDPEYPGDRAKAGYLGSERDGGFAEFVAVPAESALAIESDLGDAELASFPTAYLTAEGMLDRARVAAGETLLVTGASGGVGLAMVEIARALGATVLAGATSREKGDLALAHGAGHWIDLGVGDLHAGVRGQVAAITGEALCDVVIDVVGGAVFDAAMRCVGYGGAMVIVGFATMDISMPKGHHILLKNISVIGAPLDIHLRNQPEDIQGGMARVMDWLAEGLVRPEITRTYTLDDIHAALARFAERSVTGRLVVTTGRG